MKEKHRLWLLKMGAEFHLLVDQIGGLEISGLDGTAQQSVQPAMFAEATENQVQEHLQDGFYEDSSTTFVYENLMLGRPWTTGLFNCGEDQRNAIMTAFLPCVTFGQIAEVLSEGKFSCRLGSFAYSLLMVASYSQWCMSTEFRTKLRKKFDLEEGPYTDVASHIFCPCCSLCQEYRELKARGLDPALGWNGILAQQQESQDQDQSVDIPPTNQVMEK